MGGHFVTLIFQLLRKVGRLSLRKPPSHVPGDMIFSLDSVSKEAKKKGCPFEWMTAVKKKGDMVFDFPGISATSNSWIPTRPEDIKVVLANSADFSSTRRAKYSDLIGTELGFIPFES